MSPIESEHVFNSEEPVAMDRKIKGQAMIRISSKKKLPRQSTREDGYMDSEEILNEETCLKLDQHWGEDQNTMKGILLQH